MAEKVLLDLNTLIQRPAIDVDGTRYELFSVDELSVLASHRFSVWARRIEAIEAGTDEEEAAELAVLVDKVAQAALVDMPAAVFETLSGAQRREIANVFIALLLRKQLAAVGAITRAMGVQPTGATSSPGSSDITAATPDGGWLKRLLRWCGLI
ncbi:hypothetical protein [Sphingopyxis sp. GW247-27LB]|uniref:hypothetical protein n=1 Tax=Sphingopyxis sp. GW247-27LB TaxID=2012632 RepID=UPI000BA66C3F|nr:hypothetical protein [Sphingopyxis sp. GW247-27LB]PAL20224.1 hypothetical protein CD928_17610 [Sphingopyxis sp. GW247-27LB]